MSNNPHYTLYLNDTFGDGWDSGSIKFFNFIDDTLVAEYTLTLADGGASLSIPGFLPNGTYYAVLGGSEYNDEIWAYVRYDSSQDDSTNWQQILMMDAQHTDQTSDPFVIGAAWHGQIDPNTSTWVDPAPSAEYLDNLLSIAQGDIAVQFLQVDAYGDGWNGNILHIINDSGGVVEELNGPANNVEESHTIGLMYGSYEVISAAEGAWDEEVSLTISTVDPTDGTISEQVFFLPAGHDIDLAPGTVIGTFELIDPGSGQILDSIPPVITVLGDNPVTITEGATYSDAGAMAVDNIDGAVAVATTGGVTQDQNLLNGISAHLPMGGDLSVIGSSGITSVSGHQTVNTADYIMGDRSLSFTGGQLTNIGNLGATPDQGTISFWIKPSSTAGTGNPMSTNGQSGNNAIRFEFNWQNKNKLGVYVGNGGTYSGASFGDDNSMSAGNWYLITFTWDKTEGASGTARAYKDGVLESTHTTINDFLPNNLNNVVLGGGYSGAGERYYNGLMNGLAIHSRALSAEDITYMYNAGAGRSQFTDAAGAQAGTYTVTYTATDTAGNEAAATREVIVTAEGALLAPTLTVSGPDPYEATSHDGALVSRNDFVIEAIDDDGVGDDISDQVIITDPAGNTVPYTFPVGTHTLTFTVTNEDGMSTSATTEITIADTMIPNSITIPDDIVVEQFGAALFPEATATDIATPGNEIVFEIRSSLLDDDDNPILHVPGEPVPTSHVGVHEYTYVAIDASGNQRPAIWTVTVTASNVTKKFRMRLLYKG